jgi:hypothetical protein
MSAVAAAVGATVVGAGASYLSGQAQADAAEAGINAQSSTAAKSLAFQKEQAELQREDFAPWRDMGEEALEDMWAGIQSGKFDVGVVDVTQDPGYQWRMDQGIKAQDASASARGNLLSGAQQKSLAQYGQGLASQEYGNAYNRQAQEKANQYNMYAGMSNAGQNAAAGQAGASANLAAGSANTYGNLGNALQSGYQAQGNANANMYGGLATSANQGIQNWLTYKEAQPKPDNTTADRIL